MKATWILTGILALSVLATGPVLRLVYRDVTDVSPATLAYWLAVPDAIKAVPVITPCDAPRYSAKARRRGSPATGQIIFSTEASLQHAQAVMASHFAGDSCVAEADGLVGQTLICPTGDRVLIAVTAGDRCNDISVSWIQHDP